MSNLYKQSVETYQRVLSASIGVLEKGAAHFQSNGTDLNEIVAMKLADDMAPFPFQINSIKHHALGAANGLLSGEFTAPPETPELDYQGLTDFLRAALVELDNIDVESIEARAGEVVTFRMGDFEMPFTAENFIHSFSLPNLYFHATTLYDMLRIKGVPLGKMDFLGNMNMGLPDS